MNFLLYPFWLIFGLIEPAYADCACACVNGVNQPICSSNSELPPQCSPELCPAASFELRPIDTNEMGPIGTQRCSPYQVFENGKYVWRELCE